MLDAAASAAARDAGATLALEAEAGKYELERAFLKAARKGIIGSTGQVRKSARVGAHRRNVQVLTSMVFRSDQ